MGLVVPLQLELLVQYSEMSRLTRDGTAEPVSRDQILRHERGQGNIDFPSSADHMQDRQPYPVDPCSCYMCDHTYSVCTCSCRSSTDSRSDDDK